jgi:spore photoproduct lyase
MMDKLLKTAAKAEHELTFEIGSNSDLVLENSITGNLEWTITEFGKSQKGRLTLPTKFDMVDPLLNLPHNGRTIIRMSVNPPEFIRKIEFGTSTLDSRINAINRLSQAGYPVGILIAPVVMLENWEEQYTGLIEKLVRELSERVKREAFFEIIFMTYSYVHRMINSEAFPGAVELYNPKIMTGRGRGKYMYRPALKTTGAAFFKDIMERCFPGNTICYIV